LQFFVRKFQIDSISLEKRLKHEADTVTFIKNATLVVRSLFSAQYFGVTETNKGQVFDIFTDKSPNIVSQYDFWTNIIF
jgi:hypothetical protein